MSAVVAVGLPARIAAPRAARAARTASRAVAPFRAAFDAARQPYVASSGRLLVSAPNGQLFELFEEAPRAERFDAAAARAAVAASRRCAPNERDVKCR